MAGLEAVLRITAKDDAAPALAKVKAEIAQLDKQVAIFDKMSAAVGKITKATDPMVRSIDASTRALSAQRGAEAPPLPPVDVDEFRRRRREHELAARLDELGRRNSEAFVGQQRAFMAGSQTRNDADWRGC
jgi:hypothetical protein